MHLCGKQLLLQKYFTSYLTGTCFSSFLRSHLEAEIFKKILYLFKKLGLEMAP